MNLANFLTDTASRIPDHPGIGFEAQSITFAEMNRRVDALAHGLTRSGLRPGEFCVLMVPDCLSWPLCRDLHQSSTTGVPKGAVLTHKNLMSDAVAIAHVRHTEADDIVLSVLPLFHWYGQTHSLNTSVYLGLTMHRRTRLEAEAEIDFPSKEVVLWKML